MYLNVSVNTEDNEKPQHNEKQKLPNYSLDMRSANTDKSLDPHSQESCFHFVLFDANVIFNDLNHK